MKNHDARYRSENLTRKEASRIAEVSIACTHAKAVVERVYVKERQLQVCNKAILEVLVNSTRKSALSLRGWLLSGVILKNCGFLQEKVGES